MDNDTTMSREEVIIHNVHGHLNLRPEVLTSKDGMDEAIKIWNSLPELKQLSILQTNRRKRVMEALDSLDSFDVAMVCGELGEDTEYLSIGCEFELVDYMKFQQEEWANEDSDPEPQHEAQDNIIPVNFKERTLH